MKVHEIMTAHARCAGPDNSLVEAAGAMRELDVGSLPVCENDRLVGLITDRDIAIRAVADGRDPNTTLVRDVMSSDVVHADAEQAVEEAARLMRDREIRRLPVLNRSRQLVGILALADIAMSSSPAFSGMTLRNVSEPENPNGRQRRRDAMGRAAGAGQPLRAMSDNADSETDSNSSPRPAKRAGATRAPATRKRASTGGKKAKSPSRSNRRGDRGRISSERHEVAYAGKKVGRNGAARVKQAKKALGRKTGRKTVMRRAKTLK